MAIDVTGNTSEAVLELYSMSSVELGMNPFEQARKFVEMVFVHQCLEGRDDAKENAFSIHKKRSASFL